MLLSLALLRQLKAAERARAAHAALRAYQGRIWHTRLDRLTAYLRDLRANEAQRAR